MRTYLPLKWILFQYMTREMGEEEEEEEEEEERGRGGESSAK